MERWIIIYLSIIVGMALVGFLVLAWRLGWYRKFREWNMIRKEPEAVLYVRMHYDGGLFHEFYEKFNKWGFYYEGGLYLVNKKAIQHKRSHIQRNKRKDVLGTIDYIYGYPFPIVYFSKDKIIEMFVARAKQDNLDIMEDIKRRLANKEEVKEEDYIKSGSEALFSIDTDSLRDIEKNTLVKQLLQAMSNDAMLTLIVILVIGLCLVTTYVLLILMGVVEGQPLKAVCMNIAEKVVQKG